MNFTRVDCTQLLSDAIAYITQVPSWHWNTFRMYNMHMWLASHTTPPTLLPHVYNLSQTWPTPVDSSRSSVEPVRCWCVRSDQPARDSHHELAARHAQGSREGHVQGAHWMPARCGSRFANWRWTHHHCTAINSSSTYCAPHNALDISCFIDFTHAYVNINYMCNKLETIS